MPACDGLMVDVEPNPNAVEKRSAVRARSLRRFGASCIRLDLGAG
jgi:hypothetical protein